jgi:hypothetical protein
MGNSVRRYLGYDYALVQGHVPSGPPILSCDSVREAKCTCLGYETRLNMLYTLDPVSISFSEEQPFSNTGPRARK